VVGSGVGVKPAVVGSGVGVKPAVVGSGVGVAVVAAVVVVGSLHTFPVRQY
jgi:uncharacterized membrane protein